MRSGKVIHIGAMFVTMFLTALPALAQGRSDVSDNPAASDASFPMWAYPWDPKVKLPPGDHVPRSVPGSSATFSMAQAQDLYFAPDWHPDDHPPMPEIVARGRKPEVRACGSCHRAEGTGGPENASLAGLPAPYIVQQVADFKSGARKASGPARGPVNLMLQNAKALTDAEVQSAAEYFSRLKPKALIKVVETDLVPMVRLNRNHYVALKSVDKEPIGLRIVEVPADAERFELRDARSPFIAYVPTGSIGRGEALAKTGGSGTTVPCATCHGSDLKGVGPIPSIAGRSPSYLVRQLYDFKQGARAGSLSPLMRPTVEKLAVEDMVALAAYLASLAP
ncbi:c-type cytochrome [Accumulibacter sp.]|uniref:c-type cytochrome n=2 Tax=Accumulibacter sp. TaxID=2053492 RepID=UPI00258DA0E2|nr:c-type cytochrome [Accumulibacter sp.]MCM8578790.1 c-type cytochrome [Accumulibacter sp.]